MSSRFVKLCVLACLGAVAPAFAQPFTYQGQLKVGGVPATGLYDFLVRLYPSAEGGSPVGDPAGYAYDDLTLDGGAWTALIDPGPGVLTGQALWLDIGVRDGNQTGAYTPLAPRQRITPTPYAARALSEWWRPGTGTGVLTNDSTRQHVLVNRENPLTGAEYFGFTAPVTDGAFGGMYINTPGLNSIPFYGYSTGNGARACWTFYKGDSQTWGLYNFGERLLVDPNGNVGIGTTPAAKLDVSGTVRATSFAYSTPVSRTISIPGAAFQPTTAANLLTRENAISGTYFDASVAAAGLVAPVQLPQGAVLQSVTLWVFDSAAGAFTLKVQRRPHGQFGSVNAALSGSSANSGTIQTLSVNPALTIDNAANSYYLLVENGDWQGTSSSVYSAIVTYTQTTP